MSKQPPQTQKSFVGSFFNGLLGDDMTKKDGDKKLAPSGSQKDLTKKTSSNPPPTLHTSSSTQFKEPPKKIEPHGRTASLDVKPRTSMDGGDRGTVSIDLSRQSSSNLGKPKDTGSRTSFDGLRSSSSLDLQRGDSSLNLLQDPPQPKKLTPWKGITNGIKFEGFLDENRKFSGRCRLVYNNSDEYEGDFLNHKMHGTAACKYDHEGILFKGSWRFNRVRGDVPSAVHYQKSGDVYFGTVKNAEFVSNALLIKILKHGKGEYHSANGEKYYGNWKNDMKSGFGLMEYANQEKYYGTWEDDFRNGHGLLIYKDGTLYEGEFKQDQKNGNGKMTFCNGDVLVGTWVKNEIKNGTIKKGEISDTSRCTRLLLREQIGKVNVAKMNYSLVTQNDLTGDKWSGFFTLSKLGETLSKGSIKEISITEILHSNDVGILVNDFVNMFHWKYDNTGNEAQVLLPHAIDDFLGFYYQFHAFLSKILEGQTYNKSDLTNDLKSMIITRIYKPLFALYKKIYKEQDSMCKYKLLSLSQITMVDLGISPKLRLNYTDAIKVLASLSEKQTPYEKFDILVSVSDEVMKLVIGDNIGGADDLFPVFLYIFILCRLPHVYSEFMFLTDFLDELVSKTQKYYRFNNFEMAIQYINLLDWNIRDEKGVLVPILYFEEKLERAVSDVIHNASKSKSTMPKLMWLTNLFIDLGNCDRKIQMEISLQKYSEFIRQVEICKSIIKSCGLGLVEEVVMNKETGMERPVHFVNFDIVYPSNFYFKMANVLEKILQRV